MRSPGVGAKILARAGSPVPPPVVETHCAVLPVVRRDEEPEVLGGEEILVVHLGTALAVLRDIGVHRVGQGDTPR
ncbi:hypothetical protein [Micromonospora sp. NPDC047738]|uniref:hypothetical protein n=1 Tax=unclassified Micromonospora TaxID=2617518 RepID=UPI0033FC319C